MGLRTGRVERPRRNPPSIAYILVIPSVQFRVVAPVSPADPCASSRRRCSQSSSDRQALQYEGIVSASISVWKYVTVTGRYGLRRVQWLWRQTSEPGYGTGSASEMLIAHAIYACSAIFLEIS